MYKTYYYPISSTSLASIFASACIFPAALYQNRNKDIQSRLSEVVLLTSNFGCQESDCCLEVILTQDEIKDYLLDLNNGFFIYEKPIPVSRIKKIYFENRNQVSRTITAIRMSTAFIPDSIVDRNDNKFSDTSTSIAELPNDFVTSIDVLVKKQMEFDRVLGSLALMKVAHTAECNVSPRYIDALSFFNTEIKEAKSKVGKIDESYYKVFENPNNILKNVVSEQTIETQAEKENQHVVKNKITKIIDTDNLDGWAYIYAILYTYGVENESKKKRVDQLILDNFQGIKKGKEEKVAFSYGYNRGYSILGNVYQNDRISVAVKYKLESLLDYYTIESVFNYVIFNRVSGFYEYFDWVKPIHNRKAKKGEYIIVDTLIHDKKKIVLFSEDWWNEYLPIFLKKDDITFWGLDLTSTLVDKLISPWTEFLRNELQEQFEEEKERLAEQTDKEILLLRESLSEATNRIDTLSKANNDMESLINTLQKENERLKIGIGLDEKTMLEVIGSNSKMSSSDVITSSNINAEPTSKYESNFIPTIGDNVSLDNSYTDVIKEINTSSDSINKLSLVDMREYASKVIDYAFMNKTELRNLAKEKGIKLPKKADTKNIILLLLELNCETQLEMPFN